MTSAVFKNFFYFEWFCFNLNYIIVFILSIVIVRIFRDCSNCYIFIYFKLCFIRTIINFIRTTIILFIILLILNLIIFCVKYSSLSISRLISINLSINDNLLFIFIPNQRIFWWWWCFQTSITYLYKLYLFIIMIEEKNKFLIFLN